MAEGRVVADRSAIPSILAQARGGAGRELSFSKKVVITEFAPSTTRRPDGKPGRNRKMGVGDSVAVARQIRTVFEAAQPAL